MNYENKNPYSTRYVRLGQLPAVQEMPCCSSRNNNERSTWDKMMAGAMNGQPLHLVSPAVLQQWWEPPRVHGQDNTR